MLPMFTSLEGPPLTTFELSILTTSAMGSEQERMSTVTDEQHFLVSPEAITERTHIIIVLTVVITLIHMGFVALLKDKGKKLPFQMVNLVVNTSLSITGIYCWFFLLPQNPTGDEKSNYPDLFIFGCTQIAYQIWSIPMSIYNGDRAEMMGHHISAFITACFTVFFTTGFRYDAVYFYGILESSSVPLSIMNLFKDNPEWIKARPGVHSMSRTTFAVVFFFVRVVFLIPVWFNFFFRLWDISATTDGLALIGCRVLAYSSIFLYILQWYWFWLIAKALFKKKKPTSDATKKSK